MNTYKLIITDLLNNKILDYVTSPYKTKKDSINYFKFVINENPILLNKEFYRFEICEVIENVNYAYR